MVQAIVFLPLFGFLIAGLFGRVLGARPSELITTGFLIVGAILSWVVFFDVGFGRGAYTVQLASWMRSGALAAAKKRSTLPVTLASCAWT